MVLVRSDVHIKLNLKAIRIENYFESTTTDRVTLGRRGDQNDLKVMGELFHKSFICISKYQCSKCSGFGRLELSFIIILKPLTRTCR